MLLPLRSGSELRFSIVTSGSDSLSIRICRFGTSGLPTASVMPVPPEGFSVACPPSAQLRTAERRPAREIHTSVVLPR